MESEGGSRNDFLDFKWTSLLHLEFLGSSYMKIGHFQAYLLSEFPGSELGCDPLFHLLLSYLMSGHHAVVGSGEI